MLTQPKAAATSLPTLIDMATAAEHLGVSLRHVRRLVAEKRIPYVKVGTSSGSTPPSCWRGSTCTGSTQRRRGAAADQPVASPSTNGARCPRSISNGVTQPTLRAMHAFGILSFLVE